VNDQQFLKLAFLSTNPIVTVIVLSLNTFALLFSLENSFNRGF